ncbi:MAG: peptide/nickel transport system ATP-binding protein [Halobacteriales archaeon]|jgi:peptide/nickel transport system ATP-binding protein
MSRDPLLSVEDLTVHFDTPGGTIKAVESVSFEVYPSETVCLVGESGSGKTVAGETLTRLIPSPPGRVVDGSVRFGGLDLTTIDGGELRSIRGNRIGHVFQNPQNALDPAYTVGDQVAETIELHEDADDAHERAVELLDQVDLPRPATAAGKYPHELSGGVKQRVVIATALAADPDLLIADEPTTALDVVTQAQILRLLADLQAERDLSVLFVTHDLGVVSAVADRVVVVYAGRVMERGPTGAVLEDPAHPYTRALLASLPGRGESMESLQGSFPDPVDRPEGCRFHPRCPHAIDECREAVPPEHEVSGSRSAAPSGNGHRSAACIYYGPDHDPGDLETRTNESNTTDRRRDGDAP